MNHDKSHKYAVVHIKMREKENLSKVSIKSNEIVNSITITLITFQSEVIYLTLR